MSTFGSKLKPGASCPSVLCTVDLRKHPDVSLQLHKVGSDPYCEMSLDGELKEQISLAGGSTASLSFLDCPSEDVRLTASQTISKTANAGQGQGWGCWGIYLDITNVSTTRFHCYVICTCGTNACEFSRFVQSNSVC